MVSLLRLCCIAIVVGLMTSSPAYADDTKQAGKHVEAGDRLKKRAEAAKDGGRDIMARRLFAAAAFEYESAYDLVPHPLMLYNLAQVARLTGDDDRALRLYQKFLAEETKGDAANFARSYVRILKRKQLIKEEEEGLKNDSKDPKEAEEPVEDPDEPVEEAEEAPIPERPNPGITPKDSGKGMRYTGIGLGSAGLLSLVLGAKFGLDARSISTTLSNHDTAWTDKEVALDREGEDASSKMLLFTGIGAAALVGGGVLYYLGSRDDAESSQEQASFWIAPQLDSQSVSLGLLGRF